LHAVAVISDFVNCLEITAWRSEEWRGMRVLERPNLLRRYPNLEVGLPELDKSYRQRTHEANSRKPVNPPDQRKPQYHRKERQEESDGSVTGHVQVPK
jgi:hypothetical protein